MLAACDRGYDGTQVFPDNPGDPAGKLLYVDFNNRAVGPYAVDDIKSDFQVNLNGYNDYESGMAWGSLDIVSDPAGEARGNVMRVKRIAGKGGNGTGSGGMSFRADFTPQEEVYLAYDMYVAPDHEWTFGQKNPGLITGTMLQASHDYGVKPDPEGVIAFSARITSDNPNAWPARGDGAMSVYYYDADATQKNDFWNTIDPSLKEIVGQYNQPRGYWITVEERIKMNTVTEEGVSGLKDGLAEVWVTDPQRWDGARKVSSQPHRWRYTKTMKIDGLWMVNYYGGDGSNPVNQPAREQYHYYDNFIVSTSPITH